MQFLKALIVIMGVMIIAGFTFLGVELYRRISDPERRAGADTERATAPAGRAEEVTLGLPAGARLGDPVAVGNRVVFRATIPDAADRLYVMDPRTGAIAVTVTAGAAAP
ncbi:hypothetical protein [Azospirillum brasilense]|uniref:Uncharacterized protein n=1 Tax=Azospirillum brasilense TaxID=192 RepID=A0A6L3B7I7_AZOBR|nr:hypothetical protein [Azospirillum brasilense]KAA0688652.1 hypothetical protein DS837_02735 [Azospirillum brasilense]